MSAALQDKFIRFGSLAEMVGLSRTTIYRLEQQGQFPRRVKLGSNSVAWRMSEVLNWMAVK
ncbi:AlpA family phage regulatory protein [Pseudomonas plecoglossicida]|uniref:helix-turn-helix transcriptional regulator n=1 Tax=Pseudomonas TaxID=286 RepID=UPI0018D733BF|nr:MULTISPECIES: AlpA family phage regulatory protein [Pseudomonas]MBH3384681.1 AlpA family phage regulatory protein [Pseudomonas juntendi]MDG9917854.1 AlpA family phage regulatory protein [Pseudomonas juntendi]MDH0506309.1 AlpA family phage regulatory protein [Pseudomonas juntendi]MDH1044569.1 AlpA family phage regulatory protein [Pseudomonas juntendi]MDQ7965122.1 AlpA family phage regulatory protein [Pseudomonas plecoglossicida]